MSSQERLVQGQDAKWLERSLEPSDISIKDLQNMWNFLHERQGNLSAGRKVLRSLICKVRYGQGLGEKLADLRQRRNAASDLAELARGCLCQG
jgi:hypothetical protein